MISARCWLAGALALLAFGLPVRAEDVPDPDAQLEDELAALGYLEGSDDSEEAGTATGVVLHRADLAVQGLNFFTSGHAPVALLMDMQGNVLHEWRAEFQRLFPDASEQARKKIRKRNYWRDAVLLPGGDIIAIWDLRGIFRLDRDSNIVWVVPGRPHHAFELTPDGRIRHLASKRREMKEIPGPPALDDLIVTRDLDGNEISRLSIADAMANADWPRLRDRFWQAEETRVLDLDERLERDPFHTNSVSTLTPGQAQKLGGGFEAGDALVSIRMLDTIAVIDMQRGVARWWQQGPFVMQHQPRVTQDGRIVLFNNRPAPARSSVQILDPRTREIVWEYTGPADEPLYSKRSSGVEVLPGGHLLIFETDRGRVLEITREGEVVWAYRTPYRVGKRKSLSAGIYSWDRLPPGQPAWLQGPPSP